MHKFLLRSNAMLVFPFGNNQKFSRLAISFHFEQMLYELAERLVQTISRLNTKYSNNYYISSIILRKQFDTKVFSQPIRSHFANRILRLYSLLENRWLNTGIKKNICRSLTDASLDYESRIEILWPNTY